MSGAEYEQGYPVEDIETGEKILTSPITGHRYRVTRWVNKGDGKFVALEKQRIGRHPNTDNHPTGGSS